MDTCQILNHEGATTILSSTTSPSFLSHSSIHSFSYYRTRLAHSFKFYPLPRLLSLSFLPHQHGSKPHQNSQRTYELLDTPSLTRAYVSRYPSSVQKLQDAFASSGLSSNPIDLPQIAGGSFFASHQIYTAAETSMASHSRWISEFVS